MQSNKVMAAKDYGRVRITLKQLMDQRGINRNTLARSIGARFEVVDKWYGGKVEKLDLDVLARICYVLDCQVADIVSYQE